MSSPDPQAAGFIQAASEQVSHRLGWNAPVEEPARREVEAHGFVTTLVERAVSAFRLRDERELDEAAHELASHAPVLAAFFQNIDLLYADGFAEADAVSALVMRALEFSAEMPHP